jgi:EAL domain-containing protein (putative c-di-GMP-specific phosphodiesterase class I)
MSPEVPHAKVLVVDDDELFLRVCRTVLKRAGIHVETAASASAALERIRVEHYDAIVSDIRMPGGDGIGLLRAARAMDASIPFLLMTGVPTVETAISAIEHGAIKYLQKPFDVDHFVSVVTEALNRRDGGPDLPALHRRLDAAMAQMSLAYQPIVRVSTGTIVAYEALLRTAAPDIRGPLDILELAERTSRLFEVGRAVRARAATDMAALDESVLLFVNLHPADIEDPDLYSMSSPLAANSKRVVLEITERASVSHLASLDGHTHALRSMGFRIAVDDLGAGYAGLTTFARVKPEFVKLDASLVRDIHSASTQQLVVSSVMDMARELGSQVVAEAIETAKERDALRALGIDVMQGYFFARPAKPFVTLRSELLGQAA